MASSATFKNKTLQFVAAIKAQNDLIKETPKIGRHVVAYNDSF